MTRTHVVISVVCRNVNCQHGDWAAIGQDNSVVWLQIIWAAFNNIWACFSNKSRGYIPIKDHPFSPFMVISTPIGDLESSFLTCMVRGGGGGSPRRQQVWGAKKDRYIWILWGYIWCGYNPIVSSPCRFFPPGLKLPCILIKLHLLPLLARDGSYFLNGNMHGHLPTVDGSRMYYITSG